MKKEQRLTKLHDLPEFEFETGTALDNVIKSVGDDRTPRQLINDWNAWSMTVQDFVSQVRAGGKTVSES